VADIQYRIQSFALAHEVADAARELAASRSTTVSALIRDAIAETYGHEDPRLAAARVPSPNPTTRRRRTN
jgi:predicted transcriptional regulator